MTGPSVTEPGLRAALERLMAVAMVEEEDQSPATQDEWIAAMKQANDALSAPSVTEPEASLPRFPFAASWHHAPWCRFERGEEEPTCNCGLSEFRVRNNQPAEAAALAARPALDVERLAEALLSRDFSTLHRCGNCYHAEAEAIAAEYARLAPQEPTPEEPAP